MIDDRLREELGALLDGALPDEQAAALRQRIESDAAVRREYEELERTVAAVRGLPRATAPVELRAGVKARLAATRAPVVPVHRGWFTMPRFAAAAALLVAVSLAFYGARNRGDGVQREPTVAKATKNDAPADAGVDKDSGRPLVLRAEADDLEEAGVGDAAADDTHVGALETASKKKEARAPAPAPAGGKVAGGSRRAVEKAKDASGDAGGESKGVIDLVRAAERDRRELVGNRVAYLEQLSRLPAEKVQLHVYSLGANAKVAAVESPVLNIVTIDAGNANEAGRIAGALRGWTTSLGASALKEDGGVAGASPASSGFASVRGAAFMSATLRATPDEMRRIQTWLTLVSVPAPKAKKAAQPAERDAREATEKSRGGGGGRTKLGTKRREYKVVIRYPKPVPPPPAAGPVKQPDKR